MTYHSSKARSSNRIAKSTQGSNDTSRPGSSDARIVLHRGSSDQEDERIPQAETVVGHECGRHDMDEREPSASSWRPDRDSDVRHHDYESSTTLAHPLNSGPASCGDLCVQQAAIDRQVNGQGCNTPRHRDLDAITN